ncbi:MAG: hypothetical protein WC761_01410 [Candidatus Paceibacterota bacterium]|jgi:hypothetical protein
MAIWNVLVGSKSDRGGMRRTPRWDWVQVGHFDVKQERDFTPDVANRVAKSFLSWYKTNSPKHKTWFKPGNQIRLRHEKTSATSLAGSVKAPPTTFVWLVQPDGSLKQIAQPSLEEGKKTMKLNIKELRDMIRSALNEQLATGAGVNTVAQGGLKSDEPIEEQLRTMRGLPPQTSEEKAEWTKMIEKWGAVLHGMGFPKYDVVFKEVDPQLIEIIAKAAVPYLRKKNRV